MNNFDDYKNFFELREKYPEHLKLIAELMSAFFLNKDSFPNKFRISGTYSQEDIAEIFKALGFCNITSTSTYIRNEYVTYITLT